MFIRKKNVSRNYCRRNLANLEFVSCMRASGMGIYRLTKRKFYNQMNNLESYLKILDKKLDYYEKLLA